MNRLEAVLVDVGGTLWPNTWPSLPDDAGIRIRQLCQALPKISAGDALELVDRLLARVAADGGGATERLWGKTLEQGTDAAIRETLIIAGFPASRDVVTCVRRALCLPIQGRLQPFDGAELLLSTIHSMGLRCVVASNTSVRDAEVYRRDFESLGLARYLDAIVTSVDVGRIKPHEALFREAAKQAGTDPARCLMIGNSEEADIVPAARLGMRTIRVHPEEPSLANASVADAVAPTLADAAKVLISWR